ncbi:hypothetical protein CA85_46620 [Allorhodopirellula solitaria]|uniref:Uncharacterized protein n=1 Tax=Allorhodopirellula solitaria TaxID=2527987 RepID=A0A5C5WYB3_9BACT|nr:hypothetical protein CA85_46620 [Allorhodopirellula solitaria]
MSELFKFCLSAVVAMVVGVVCIQIIFTSIEHFVSKVSTSDFPNDEEIDGISQPVTYQSYMFFSLPRISFEVTGVGSAFVLLGVVFFFAGICFNYSKQPRRFGDADQASQISLLSRPSDAPELSDNGKGLKVSDPK